MEYALCHAQLGNIARCIMYIDSYMTTISIFCTAAVHVAMARSLDSSCIEMSRVYSFCGMATPLPIPHERFESPQPVSQKPRGGGGLPLIHIIEYTNYITIMEKKGKSQPVRN